VNANWTLFVASVCPSVGDGGTSVIAGRIRRRRDPAGREADQDRNKRADDDPSTR
jgi:hypothetical protein